MFNIFETVADDRFQLTGIVETWTRRDEYEPILHAAWTQFGYPRNETEPYALADMPVFAPGLDGSVTLSLGRFLHLEMDLKLDPDTASADESAESVREDGDRWLGFGFDDDPYLQTVEEAPRVRTLYSIQEDRIVKRDEYHYFDHPRFGVIAIVTAVEPEEEDEELLDEDFLEPG